MVTAIYIAVLVLGHPVGQEVDGELGVVRQRLVFGVVLGDGEVLQDVALLRPGRVQVGHLVGQLLGVDVAIGGGVGVLFDMVILLIYWVICSCL